MIQAKLIKMDFADILPASLANHGFFIFDAPPFETPFGYRDSVKPGEITDTCWGVCRNGVPLELPTVDDYFGIAVVDKDRKTLVQGYYTDILIPAYEWVAWFTENHFSGHDIIMPDTDWHLICYVGYYDPLGNILYQTDYIEFTIKAGTPFSLSSLWWLLLLLPVLFIKKKAKI